MEEIPKAPVKEQKICVKCGFCCNGTLFEKAHLDFNEKGNLPKLIQQNYFQENNAERFKLPCPYFNQKCTIYDKTKPKVCSSFRCQLLKSFADNKISQEDATKIVNNTKELLNELQKLYFTVSGDTSAIPFRDLLKYLDKIQKSAPKGESLNTDFEFLIARSNIFESLLLKYFKSEKDFNEMMESSTNKTTVQ